MSKSSTTILEFLIHSSLHSRLKTVIMRYSYLPRSSFTLQDSIDCFQCVSEDEIMSIKGVGPKGLDELRMELSNQGVTLKN